MLLSEMLLLQIDNKIKSVAEGGVVEILIDQRFLNGFGCCFRSLSTTYLLSTHTASAGSTGELSADSMDTNSQPSVQHVGCRGIPSYVQDYTICC